MSEYLNKIVYLSESEYATLVANGTITKNNISLNYNANDLYITPDNDPRIKYGITAYWNAQINYIPAAGEIIIYTDYESDTIDQNIVNIPGIKVGDGINIVTDLPFVTDHIDRFVIEQTYNDLPSIGNVNRLYLVLSSLTVYQWSQGSYTELYKFRKQQIATVTAWDAGTMTELVVSNDGKLVVTNGTEPSLTTGNINVITDFS